MGKSEGEEAYASVFQFKSHVDAKDHEKLRDFLYKYSFNLSEAYEYLFIIIACNEIDTDSKPELFHRIYGMSLQCFALCIRKITDNASERSVRKLIDLAVKPEFITDHKSKVEEIYKHYEKFLNKFVVHQDVYSVHDGVAFFPNENIIKKDLEYLREYYFSIAFEICSSFINVTGEGAFYDLDLEKLID